MVQRPPRLNSMLSQPIISDNFIAFQSAGITVATASTAVTFTTFPSGGGRVTFKISNTGTKAAYVCGSNSASIVAAIPSTSTPQPTATNLAVSTCDCIPAGAILTQDYVAGTDTLSFICASTNTTTLEISIGGGQ